MTLKFRLGVTHPANLGTICSLYIAEINMEPENLCITAAIVDRKRCTNWPRTTGHEPWRGQLPTEPRIRPLSWHGVFPSCQEPKELSTSFFWWRSLIVVETSSF